MCRLDSTIALQHKTEIQKPLSNGKTLFLRLFFLCSFRMKTFKICLAFYFLALETLLLEHSNPVKMTQKLQIQSLKVTISSKIMFAFQRTSWENYVKWHIKTQIFSLWKVNILSKQHIVQRLQLWENFDTTRRQLWDHMEFQ